MENVRIGKIIFNSNSGYLSLDLSFTHGEISPMRQVYEWKIPPWNAGIRTIVLTCIII